MFRFLKNHTYPIGVDMGNDSLQVVQLRNNGRGIGLIAGGSENRPADVEPGSGDWRKWAVETIKKLTANGKFRSKDVIAAMPASEVFIDHIKMPKTVEDKLSRVILSKIKQKLPFDSEHAMTKYIVAEDDNILVMATQRRKIDRHLAIYEKANLQIKSMGAWPVALTNSYTALFGRRQDDIEGIVMLLDIEPNCTNVVICRPEKLLFARSITIGTSRLASDQSDKMINRLVLELAGCRRHFSSMYRKTQIECLIFLSARRHTGIDKDIYTAIAEQLKIPAQVGDCLAAVETANPCDLGIDRRQCQVNWATAFGLSLS